jgi:hypothetical protein
VAGGIDQHVDYRQPLLVGARLARLRRQEV